jgi:WD40 repeat protein/serine/threonine protein kinase
LGSGITGTICPPCEFAAAMEPLQALPGSASPEDPRRFGDYELLEEIAHGGMGVVYRARHTKLNRVVALKMLLLGQFASDQAIRRFQREAQAAAALRHPGIVSVHEVGVVDGQHYFTMELVEGRSLASLLQSGPLPPRSAAVYLLAITEAVAHAHAHGIVHRDLKPSNILIDLFDATRITDFGLARRLDGTGDITLTGHIVGSPNYLAPEYLDGHTGSPFPIHSDGTDVAPTSTIPLDPAARRRPDLQSPLADLFSLGAVLYECLTGRPPFLGVTLEETLLRVRDTEPVAPRVLNQRIPKDLETICLKCLEKNPARRYPGATELAAELKRFIEGQPIHARPITAVGRAWRWARRKPALAAMVAALHVVLAAGLSGILWQWTRAESEAARADASARAAQNNLVRQYVAKGNTLSGQRRSLEALPWFLAALENEPDPEHLETHRIRLSTALRESPRLEQLGSHPQSITRLALSPDEQWVASCSEDATARVWSLATGRALTPPLIHGETVQGALFHPSGRWLLTFSSQREHRPTFGSHPMRGKGSVRIWSLPDGQPVWSSIHTNIVPRAEWSPDGTRILAACADGHARLWQFHTNQDGVRVTLELDLEHPAEVRTAGFHPSGNLFATGSRDGRFRLWDTHTGRLVREFDNAQETSNFAFYARRWDLAFSPDGSRLLGGNDYRARMWSLDSGTNRFDLALQGMLSSLRFSPDGESIVTTDLGGVVTLWSAATGQARATIPGYDHQESLAEDLGAEFTPDGKFVGFWNHGGIQFRNVNSLHPASPWIPTRQITSAQHSRDGRRLLLGTASGRIEVWNLVIPETTSRVFELGTVGTGVLFSSDGRRLVTGNWSSQVGFWDAESGRSLVPEFRQQRAASYGIASLTSSPDGQRVLATDWGGTARLYEIETGLPVSSLWTNTPGFPGVGAFLPNSNQVVTADRAGILRVHQLPDGACLRSVTNTEAMPFQQVLPTADGSLLYTVSNDGWGRCWDTATLTPHGKPFDLGGPSRNARWSPDRRRILTLNAAEGSPRVWEAGTGQQLFELTCPVTTSCGDFSPDNRWIATASVDGTVRLWDGHTGALRQQFQAGTRPLDLRFSNDGRWLAVGGAFGLRAWEVVTGEALTPLLELKANEGFANGIAFSPDGWQLAGVGGGLGARTWNLRPLDYSRDQWRNLIAALTGQRVDANGELHEIPATEQLALRDPACREFPAEFGASDL